jgi:hypothetical protein
MYFEKSQFINFKLNFTNIFDIVKFAIIQSETKALVSQNSLFSGYKAKLVSKRLDASTNKIT